MDFFSYEGAKRIGSENILVKVDQLIDWSRFSLLLKRAHMDTPKNPILRPILSSLLACDAQIPQVLCASRRRSS